MAHEANDIIASMVQPESLKSEDYLPWSSLYPLLVFRVLNKRDYNIRTPTKAQNFFQPPDVLQKSRRNKCGRRKTLR